MLTSEIFASHALLPAGWAADVRLTIENGRIASVAPGARPDGAERVHGILLPGMTDAHSHAFQRFFAGRTEHTGGGTDFWTWREAMYAAAQSMTADRLARLMTWLGREKLKYGYTRVVEFHYLHHGAKGESPAEMAGAVVAGAKTSGIGLTLLPAIYMFAGFDNSPLREAQTRFAMTQEGALRLVESLRNQASLTLGMAPHSLRAVPPAVLREAAANLRALLPGAPIHLHIAEQTAEVDACRTMHGASPLTLLLDEVSVDRNWFLVHATHASPPELRRLSETGAAVVLCPTTEADLGDGIFSFPDWPGELAIGADCNLSLSPLSELSLLEWTQRLHLRRRNIVSAPSGRTARTLWQMAAAGGARAAAHGDGTIAPGRPADLVVIGPQEETDPDAPDDWLAVAIFATPGPRVRDVMVAGEWVVINGRHRHE